MFYCEACRVKNDWPESIFKSEGPCEICKMVAICNDRPSYSLPIRKEVSSPPD